MQRELIIVMTVVASVCTIKLILASCSQPYQLIYSSDSFSDTLKVLQKQIEYPVEYLVKTIAVVDNVF